MSDSEEVVSETVKEQREIQLQAAQTDAFAAEGDKEAEESGKLDGFAAIITGGNSSIGRSAGPLYGREGADIAIFHKPDEAENAVTMKSAAAR